MTPPSFDKDTNGLHRVLCSFWARLDRSKRAGTTTPQLFYSPISGTTRVSQCEKRTSGLYGARED